MMNAPFASTNTRFILLLAHTLILKRSLVDSSVAHYWYSVCKKLYYPTATVCIDKTVSAIILSISITYAEIQYCTAIL